MLIIINIIVIITLIFIKCLLRARSAPLCFHFINLNITNNLVFPPSPTDTHPWTSTQRFQTGHKPASNRTGVRTPHRKKLFSFPCLFHPTDLHQENIQFHAAVSLVSLWMELQPVIVSSERIFIPLLFTVFNFYFYFS